MPENTTSLLRFMRYYLRRRLAPRPAMPRAAILHYFPTEQLASTDYDELTDGNWQVAEQPAYSLAARLLIPVPIPPLKWPLIGGTGRGDEDDLVVPKAYAALDAANQWRLHVQWMRVDGSTANAPLEETAMIVFAVPATAP